MYKAYLAFLHDAAVKYHVKIHAFVLMTNHVHLLLTPSDEKGISRLMQAQGRKYVQYFNHTHQRTGTLWEGRYKSTVVDTDTYLFTLYRYIELNPVRANMVKHPSDYPWSSYHANALGKPIKLISPHQQYTQLGNTHTDRQQAYRALFKGRIANRDINLISQSTQKGWALGNNAFKADLETQTGRKATPTRRGGDRKSKKYHESKNQ